MIRGPLLAHWRLILAILVVSLAAASGLLCLRIAGGAGSQRQAQTLSRPAEIDAVSAKAPSAGGLLLQVSGKNLDRVRQAALVPDFGNRHKISAELKLWGTVPGVAVAKGHAFVANLHRGLVVVDLHGKMAPKVCGSLPLPGRSWQVTVAGDLALVSALEKGLYVVDVSNPDSPRLVATIPTRDLCWSSCWKDGRVYLANGHEGVLIYDLSRPERPRRVAALNTRGMIVDVLVVGNRLYLADNRHGIRVAEFVGGRLRDHELLSVPYGYWKLAYDPGHRLLFGATKSNGLSVISLSPEGQASLLEQRSELMLCSTVKVRDNLVYVGKANGVAFLRIAPDGRLQSLGEVSTHSRVYALAGEAETLVLACIDFGLQMVDTSQLLHLSRPRRFPNLRWISAVDFSSEGQLLASPDGTLVELNKSSEARIDNSVVFPPARPNIGVWGSPEYLAVADMENGLQVLTMDAPDEPLVSLKFRGQVNDVRFRHNLLIVADNLEGLLLFDLSGGNPVKIGQFRTAGNIRSIALSANLAYLADGLGGLKIVDLGDPRHPALLGSLEWPGQAYRVVVAGRQAFLAIKGEGLVCVDCRDPRHPTIQGAPLDKEGIENLAVAGDRLFVAHKFGSVTIYRLRAGHPPEFAQILKQSEGAALLAQGDLLISSNGQQLGLFRKATDGHYRYQEPIAHGGQDAISLALAGSDLVVLENTRILKVFAWNEGSPGKLKRLLSKGSLVVARNGNIVYRAHQNILEILDLSDPQRSVPLASCQINGEVKNLLYMDGLLLATMGTDGLQVFDVRDTSSVHLVSSTRLPGRLSEMARLGDLVVIAGDSAGVLVVDVSRPDHLKLVSQIRYPEPMQSFSHALDVEVAGTLCYVADGENGLTIIDLGDPERPQIVGRAETPGAATRVHIADQRAYVIDNNIGVHIFELGDAGSVGPLETIPFSRSLRTCWRRQDQLILASRNGGLYLLPAPFESKTIGHRGDALQVAFSNKPPAGYYTLQLYGRDLMDQTQMTVHIGGAAQAAP